MVSTSRYRHKVTGYLVVGAILMFIGALLMILAEVTYTPVAIVETIWDVREALSADRKRDGMSGAGIAVLTTGILMFFGFGLSAIIAERMADSEEAKLEFTQPLQKM